MNTTSSVRGLRQDNDLSVTFQTDVLVADSFPAQLGADTIINPE